MNNVMLGRIHPDPCPECGGNLVLQYGYKYNHPFYGCQNWPRCSGSAGAHDDGKPMGRAVTKDVAMDRIVAHALVNELKRRRAWSGNYTYRWMTALFKSSETIHISDMNKRELSFLVREVQKELKFK